MTIQGDFPSARDLYIDLLKRSLNGQIVGPSTMYVPLERAGGRIRTTAVRLLRRRGGSVLCKPTEFDLSKNVDGSLSVWDLPPWCMTMIGPARLDNLEACIRDVIQHSVQGDFIETGVWRGGATILMRGMLRAYGITDRKVYVADSFEGVPPPDTQHYPADEGITLHLWRGLAVPRQEVQANFDRFGLLDDQVCFVEGWFKDTLPALADRRWALLRLDGDLYESTMDALTHLYPRLSVGGWVIVDDYAIPACKEAVVDYRKTHGIKESIQEVDFTGICWQKAN